MAAWEFCLKYCGVSEGFTHKMAECEFCLQDRGNSEFYPQYGGVEFFAYKMAAFLSLTHKMAACEFCLQDGGDSESFTHNMAVWEFCLQDGGNAKQTKRKQKQRRICITFTV